MISKYLFIRSADANDGSGGGGFAPVLVEETLIGQATDSQISDWKAKSPNGIYQYVVDGKVCYLKNPNRTEANACMSQADGQKALKMFEVLCQVTWLGGCEDIRKDDELFFGLTQVLKTKMDGKRGEAKNL